MELKKVPYDGWQQEYNRLMKDPYLSKKYNREKRIRDNRKYMGSMTPEIKHVKGKLILDIGCAMGEWLEICRTFGHDILGIDAQLGDCEMGKEYIQLSKLMTERQKVSVEYCGFLNYLNGACPFKIKKESVFYINSRGSIEQIFKDYMTGVPHRVSKKASGLRWTVTLELRELFLKMFKEFERILEDGGYVAIHANGSKNNTEYDELILSTAKKIESFHLFKRINKTFHKFRKMV